MKVLEHKRVHEKAGAYACGDCLAKWGALPGNPRMPNKCIKVESEAEALSKRAHGYFENGAERCRQDYREAHSLGGVLLAEVKRLKEALNFYANPEVYHGASFAFDRPTGGFDSDFGADHGHDGYDRPMPGRVARTVLGGYWEVSDDIPCNECECCPDGCKPGDCQKAGCSCGKD